MCQVLFSLSIVSFNLLCCGIIRVALCMQHYACGMMCIWHYTHVALYMQHNTCSTKPVSCMHRNACGTLHVALHMWH